MFRLLLICYISSFFTTILCFECKGNGYFRDPDNCAKMIRCQNGKISHRFLCGEGKVFNDITKSCDDPKYVNCQNTVTDTSVLTSPSTATTGQSFYDLPIASRLQSVSTPSVSSTDSITTSTDYSTESTTPKDITESTTQSITETLSTVKDIEELEEIKVKSTKKVLLINESFVEYESNKSIPLNESFVIYEESLSLPFNESFVVYEEEDNTETTTTDSSVESLTSDDIISTTVSTVIPTSVESNVTPVLESILQNESLSETTVTQTSDILETSTKSTPYCAIDENNGHKLRMLSSNYATNETSKLTDFYKVVCYFTNWARYRSEQAKYTVNNVNPFLCTHIIYAFAVLDNQTLTMKSSDECTDIDNRFYEQITGLKHKNPRLKVLIALGGWVDSEGDKYSRLVNNQTSRLRFIENAIQFLNRHNFDGLDLDWEYPKCWQADCSAGPESDKMNFALLIRELRIAFNKQTKPLLLTGAVGATKYIVDNAYEINSLLVNFDFINLMTYDYYTSGSPIAAHHSPLYSHPIATDLGHSFTNANFSVNYWIRKGVPSHKLMFGIPFYGRTFKLLNSGNNDFGSAANGTGSQGLYTKEKGFLSYYEICNNILRNGWAKRVDTYVSKGKQTMTGPYAYNDDQWVGYDDPDHITEKTDYIKDNNLGGAMIWALDLDDFNGICCKTKSPLLKTINQQLREYTFDLKFFCP